MTSPLIQLQRIRKAYREGDRDRVVFDGLSAAIGHGRFSVLFGRSGSGKSTLLNLVSGIDLPDAGEVVIGGVSMSALSERERTLYRRANIGFVFQFFNLVPTLSVLENLLLPLELNGIRGSEARRRALAWLARVGLDGRADSFPEQLSGGEQQRVAIVRALVHDPLLILADEPTGNLDADTGREVLELLASLTRDAGKTLVMVTHSSDAEAYADQVLLLRGGAIEEKAW